MSKLEVDAIEPQSGTTLTLGASGDTINVASGATNNLGITMADQWRLTTVTNTGTNADVTTNWERVDNTGWSGIGTGLTESSGIFSFPQTGIYLISHGASFSIQGEDTFVQFILQITLNNSSYTSVTEASAGNDAVGAAIGSGSTQFIFDVTDITNDKFKFITASFSGSTTLRGSTDQTLTGFTVLRLGDT
jgi:hypothetical protein